MPRAEPGNQPSKVEFHHVGQGGTGVSYGLRETSEDASKLTARRVLGPTPNTLGRHVLTAMPTNRPFRTLECKDGRAPVCGKRALAARRPKKVTEGHDPGDNFGSQCPGTWYPGLSKTESALASVEALSFRLLAFRLRCESSCAALHLH